MWVKSIRERVSGATSSVFSSSIKGSYFEKNRLTRKSTKLTSIDDDTISKSTKF